MTETLVAPPEQEHQEIIDPAPHITLDRMIADAAYRQGSEPIPEEDIINESFSDRVYDYSENPVFRTVVGTAQRSVPRRFEHQGATIDNGKERISVSRISNAAGMNSEYIIDDHSEVIIRTLDEDGSPRQERIVIRYAVDDKRLDPVPLKGGEPLTKEETIALKAKIFNGFGLEYAPEQPKRRAQHRDKKVSVSSEVASEVDSVIHELETEGLTGGKLRKATLARLHPDSNPDIDTSEQFKYAESLLFDD